MPCASANCGVRNWKWTYGTFPVGNGVFSGGAWVLVSDCNASGEDYICSGSASPPPGPVSGSCGGAFAAYHAWVCDSPFKVPGVDCQNSGPHEISGAGLSCFDVACTCVDSGNCGESNCGPTETCCDGTTCVSTDSFQTDNNRCGDCNTVCPQGYICVDGVCVIDCAANSCVWTWPEPICSGCGESVFANILPGDPGYPNPAIVANTREGPWVMISDCDGTPSLPGYTCSNFIQEGVQAGFTFGQTSPSGVMCACKAIEGGGAPMSYHAASDGSWALTTPCPQDCACTGEAPTTPGTYGGETVSHECASDCDCGEGDGPPDPGPDCDTPAPASVTKQPEMMPNLGPSIADGPCSQEECEAHVSTWMAEASGKPNEEGLYKVKWILLDGCPGACCSDQPTQPEFVKKSTLVDAPCKCGCS